MTKLLTAFAKRKDVWFSFISITTGAILVYAQYMPPWVIILLVVVRELLGFIGMTQNQDATAEQKASS